MNILGLHRVAIDHANLSCLYLPCSFYESYLLSVPTTNKPGDYFGEINVTSFKKTDPKIADDQTRFESSPRRTSLPITT